MITKHDLIYYLKDIEIRESAINPRDEEYLFPTIEWIETTFKDVFTKVVGNVNQVSNKSDCSALSLIAIGLAKLLWVYTPSPEAALAIATMSYIKLAQDGSPISGHTVLMVLYRDKNNQIKNKFYDLTLCLEEIRLSSDEWDTIFAVDFL